LVQFVAQVPQLLSVVCVFVSQPLLGLPSQLANPAVHDGRHTPEAQAFVP